MVAIGFFSECNGQPTDPSLLIPNVSLLPHHSLSFSRKFITLERLVMDVTRGDIFVAIGPVHAESNCSHGYAHKEIGKAVLFPDEFRINGGGMIEFHGTANHDGKIQWLAEFGDRSGEFGQFSPLLLLPDNISVLSQTMRMSVRITYNKTEWE